MRELILNLHGLGEPSAAVDEQEKQYWWSVSSFSWLLDLMADRLPGTSPKISITFDDGNASDALLALPELAKRDVKASFFVCAGRIGTKHYLDKSMIIDLIKSGMQIGSHGMHHRDWCTLGPNELDEEIVGARRRLRRHQWRSDRSCCHPIRFIQSASIDEAKARTVGVHLYE